MLRLSGVRWTGQQTTCTCAIGIASVGDVVVALSAPVVGEGWDSGQLGTISETLHCSRAVLGLEGAGRTLDGQVGRGARVLGCLFKSQRQLALSGSTQVYVSVSTSFLVIYMCLTEHWWFFSCGGRGTIFQPHHASAAVHPDLKQTSLLCSHPISRSSSQAPTLSTSPAWFHQLPHCRRCSCLISK